MAPLLAPASVSQSEHTHRRRAGNVLGKSGRCAEPRGSTPRRSSPRPGSRAGSKARGERPPRLRGALTPRLPARVGPLGSLPPRPQPRTGSRDGTARDRFVTPSRSQPCRLKEPTRDVVVLYARFIGMADYALNHLIHTGRLRASRRAYYSPDYSFRLRQYAIRSRTPCAFCCTSSTAGETALSPSFATYPASTRSETASSWSRLLSRVTRFAIPRGCVERPGAGRGGPPAAQPEGGRELQRYQHLDAARFDRNR